MADPRELDAIGKLGREQGQQERPPSAALEPDAIEVNESAKIIGRYQVVEQPTLSQLADVSRRVAAIEHVVAGLDTSATNLSDPDAIARTTDVALAERRPVVVHDIVLEKSTKANLLRFRGDRGITREAKYDSSTWELLQWMIIIFAIELGLNAYFYSVHVGLAGGAIYAAGFAFVTAALGFITGYAFRLAAEPSALRRIAGWFSILVGSGAILYIASLTATYRAISIIQEQQFSQANGAFDYAPANVAFARALVAAPTIFMFPFTLRLPFEEMQSFLLFLLSLFAFCVAFWKGFTSQDTILGYKDADKAHKEAEVLVRSRESELLQVAKSAANACAAERQSILQSFNTTNRDLAVAGTDVDHLRTQLSNGASALRREFELLVKTYRSANVSVRQTVRPDYFAGQPEIDLDVHGDVFDAVAKRIVDQKSALKTLIEAHSDHLKAEIKDAADQARIAHERVSAFLSESDQQAKQVMQEMVQGIGRQRDNDA